jgi:hypothetical protein
MEQGDPGCRHQGDVSRIAWLLYAARTVVKNSPTSSLRRLLSRDNPDARQRHKSLNFCPTDSQQRHP